MNIPRIRDYKYASVKSLKRALERSLFKSLGRREEEKARGESLGEAKSLGEGYGNPKTLIRRFKEDAARYGSPMTT